MTGAGVRNYELCNPAPEEGFCGIQRTELDEYRLESGSGRNSESTGIRLGHSGLAEHSISSYRHSARMYSAETY
jgi:hypothetical protein